MINLSQGIDRISQEIKHIRKLQRKQLVSVFKLAQSPSSDQFSDRETSKKR
jgi:hypothetical protein